MNLRAVGLTAGVVAYAVGVSVLGSAVAHIWKGFVGTLLYLGGHDAAIILGPAIWLGLAGCPLPVRLVVQLIWYAAALAANVLWMNAVYAPGTMGAANWELQWHYLATIWIIAALLVPFRYWAGAIRREPLAPKMTLKGLFGITLAIAIALALVRSGRPLVVSWEMVPAGVCTAIAVVLLTIGMPLRRKTVSACLAVAVAILWAWMCFSQGFPRIWIVTVPILEALILAPPLLACRRLGYRLQR